MSSEQFIFTLGSVLEPVYITVDFEMASIVIPVDFLSEDIKEKLNIIKTLAPENTHKVGNVITLRAYSPTADHLTSMYGTFVIRVNPKSEEIVVVENIKKVMSCPLMEKQHDFFMGVTIAKNSRELSEMKQRVDDLHVKVEELVNLLHILVESEPALGKRKVNPSLLE